VPAKDHQAALHNFRQAADRLERHQAFQQAFQRALLNNHQAGPHNFHQAEPCQSTPARMQIVSPAGPCCCKSALPCRSHRSPPMIWPRNWLEPAVALQQTEQRTLEEAVPGAP